MPLLDRLSIPIIPAKLQKLNQQWTSAAPVKTESPTAACQLKTRMPPTGKIR